MNPEEKFALVFDMDIIKKYCEEHKSEFETWKKERKDTIEDEVSI